MRLTPAFIERYHDASINWQKIRLKSLHAEIDSFKNEAEFVLIAEVLALVRLIRQSAWRCSLLDASEKAMQRLPD